MLENKKMVKHVYIVLTEYQFLQAINIATGLYNSSKYINKIYLIRSGRRLMTINEEEDWSLDNIQMVILDKKTPKKIANAILDENPEHFFIFQGLNSLNVFLGSTLSRRNVEISLGPDGYGTYNVFKKKNPILTFLKDSFIANKFLIKNKLFNGKIHPFDYYTYGNHKFIDNIWVTHPEQYFHRAKNKVNILKLPEFNENCIDFIKTCFNFKDSFPTEKVIYYFNQPLWSELVEKEFEFLEGILHYFPHDTLIIKLHPLTSEKMKIKYSSLDRVELIESTVPAEVMLLSLKNCIVLTGWSSVLLTENKMCNYYFNYPIYKNMESNNKFLNQSDLIVLEHINLIDKPELMKFPNE